MSHRVGSFGTRAFGIRAFAWQHAVYARHVVFLDSDHTARLLPGPTQLDKSQTAVYATVSRPVPDYKPAKRVDSRTERGETA